ncbi:MFS transporter [Leifsonia poae]|uniref:MFS transporter n=1 Tax=Leifsonia poae TaxID=110933 RepID=UPI001CBC12FE|nr:MFS transporter [Leifsonia poae]
MSIESPVSGPVAETSPSLWSNSAYLLLMSGKTTQIIGAGLASFAVPLIAFAMTRSVVAAGVVATVGELGALIATLPAGVIADRFDRRRLLVVCSVLGVVVWGSLVVADVLSILTVWQLGVVVFISAVLGSFYQPAESAGIRQVVPDDQLGSAMAAMEGRSAVATLIAGPVGGVLYGFSRAWPLIASTVGYAVAGICAALVRKPLNGDLTRAASSSPVTSLREGLRFVMSVSFMRTGLVTFALLNLGFGGVLYSLNLHLISIRTSPVQIGLVNAVAGGAMVLGSILAGPLVKRLPAGPLAIACLLFMVTGVAGLAATSTYGWYLIWIGVATVFVPPLNAGIIGYAVAVTPHDLQGRMNSVLSLSAVLVTPVSPIVAGALLVAIGVNASIAVFGAVLLLGVILMAANRSIRRIGRPDTWAADHIEWHDTHNPS